ncbi:hypothetical protein HEQ45_11140 [Lactobacillus sp. ZJLC29-4]|nr:hypothetical protein [Lactobacillus sp. HBUAS51387]
MITIDRFSETEMPTPFAPFSNRILLMSAEPIAVVKGWGFPNILEAYLYNIGYIGGLVI